MSSIHSEERAQPYVCASASAAPAPLSNSIRSIASTFGTTTRSWPSENSPPDSAHFGKAGVGKTAPFERPHEYSSSYRDRTPSTTKDFVDQIINVGDTVVYAVRRGSSLWLDKIVVTQVHSNEDRRLQAERHVQATDHDRESAHLRCGQEARIDSPPVCVRP